SKKNGRPSWSGAESARPGDGRSRRANYRKHAETLRRDSSATGRRKLSIEFDGGSTPGRTLERDCREGDAESFCLRHRAFTEPRSLRRDHIARLEPHGR